MGCDVGVTLVTKEVIGGPLHLVIMILRQISPQYVQYPPSFFSCFSLIIPFVYFTSHRSLFFFFFYLHMNFREK